MQSGFYQGYSGNVGYEEFDNEPFATGHGAIDDLPRGRTNDTAGPNFGVRGTTTGWRRFAQIGIVLALALALASLTSSGLIGHSSINSMGGELQRRMSRGTGVEQMMMEQQRQQYLSSRHEPSPLLQGR